MADLVLRKRANGRYALQLRDHGPAETTYFDLAIVDWRTALAITDAGAPAWLHPSEKPSIKSLFDDGALHE